MQTCPVCDRPVRQLFAKGRRRIYDTNACRQIAYQRRRAGAAVARIDHERETAARAMLAEILAAVAASDATHAR